MKTTQLLALAVITAFAAGCTTTPPPAPAAADTASATAVETAALDRLPVPRFMAQPVFPANLREPGATGSAVIAFVVDSDGEVREPKVVQATRPEFGVAAVQAVSRWKFRPGQKGGRNVNVRMSVPVEFRIANTGPAPAAPGTSLPDVFEIAALDQIPVARHLAKPVYPSNLQEMGITGRAVIGFIVDTDGNVRDPWVMEATQTEFGLAAVQAVSQWKFQPGKKGGRTVNVRMKVPVVFEIQDSTHPAPPADLKTY